MQSWCRACHKEAAAARYRQLTPEQLEQKNGTTRKLKARARGRLWDYLASQRCVDCGERDVLVLDLDHRVSKRANVADMVSNCSPWHVIVAEIAKCEVRCANCHRQQTAARRITAPKPATRGRTNQIRLRHSGTTTEFAAPQLAGGHADRSDLVRCKRCHRELPGTEFAWRSTASGIRQPWCRPCHNAQKRKHYSLNRSQEVARTSARHHKLLAENAPRLRRYLQEHPCVDCGERDPLVLEFDHLRDKRTDVKRMLWSGLLWTQIELEIREM